MLQEGVLYIHDERVKCMSNSHVRVLRLPGLLRQLCCDARELFGRMCIMDVLHITPNMSVI